MKLKLIVNKIKAQFKKSLVVALLAIISFSFVFAPTAHAQAGFIADLFAPIQTALQFVSNTWNEVQPQLKEALQTSGSKILQSTISNTLNKIAYDTASYIGSGGRGQKPQFITESVGSYLGSVADNAAGVVIDQLNDLGQFNLCEPSLDIKAKIGLGLVDYSGSATLKTPNCTFSNMKKAWTDEANRWSDMRAPDWWKKAGSVFEATDNDITIALELMSGVEESKTEESSKALSELQLNNGWISIKDIGGKTAAAPGTAERQLQQVNQIQAGNFGKYTGSVLVDAANVFLNQLALSAFQRTMQTLGAAGTPEGTKDWQQQKRDYLCVLGINKDENCEKDADGEYVVPPMFSGSGTFANGLFNSNADPSANGSNKNNLSQILKPQFDSRGDYNILSELTICNDSQNPGPTNCVLDDQFRQAIEQQKTVIEAISDGYLNKDWRLKEEIDYNQGYSLRSLMILRKYRIIPVGWETALERAKTEGQQATLMDVVSCYDANDNYSEFSAGFNPGTWCEGLVDPNWVLKAPLNYCKREGVGGQILDKTITPSFYDSATGTSIPGEVILSRADNYCADEQSCIKEKKDGTCEAYGYCIEDKRTWNFGTDSCDPVYNTCQTFTKATGESASYLENTIDYSTCDSNNAGCRPYSRFGLYSTSTTAIDWQPLNLIYLNRNVESCSQGSEGCNQFIRLQPGTGHNSLRNADFEEGLGDWVVNADGSQSGAVIVNDAYYSSQSLQLGSGGLSKSVAVAPSSYNIAGQVYTFSFYAKNCTLADTFGLEGQTMPLTADTDWRYYVTTYIYPNNVLTSSVNFHIDSSSCLVDRLKIELGGTGTYYSNYGDNSLITEKLLPGYLGPACYRDITSATKDYRLKDNAPAACNQFVRRCNADEAGCELYTDTTGYQVPAKTVLSDSCPGQCVGYNTYIQKETYFNTSTANNLIPETATGCSASAVGCNEFTNLDTLSQGGEAKEYYSYLKKCIKPDANTCASFYSWEGLNNGYQLATVSLKKNGEFPELIAGVFAAPVSGTNDSIEIDIDSLIYSTSNILCSEEIYNASPSDPIYNPDCRQYYNTAGHIAYRLTSHVVTCSDNCHPYRISETISQTKCTDTGGAYDSTQNECIYNAIPGEGTRCSATENGCREYDGNSGNNIRIVSAYDFENNITDWMGLCASDQGSSSTDSLSNGGHSLQYTPGGDSLQTPGGDCGPSTLPAFSVEGSWLKRLGKFFKNFLAEIAHPALAESVAGLPGHGLAVKVGHNVSQDNGYNVKFLAKANSGQSANLTVYLTNGGSTAAFNANDTSVTQVAITGNGDWQVYQLNLPTLDHAVSGDEALVIKSDNQVYIDNLVLTEIYDKYYLIKDSWNTPNVCYYDTFNNYQGVNYNLGCAQYSDRSGATKYLRNFSGLCSDGSVGCELMIDTKNSNSPDQQAWNESPSGNNNNECDSPDGIDCTEVPADEMMYAVYDANKLCSASDKGCSLLGAQISVNPDVATQVLYADAYVKNDPEKYDTSLCMESEVGCNEWQTLDGQSSYFRDPGNNVCEWRPAHSLGMNIPKKWYKRAVKRCDMDNNGAINTDSLGNITESINKLCAYNTDCVTGTCILDENDYLCPVDSLKTVGYGGAGNQVYQPQGITGVCDPQAAGCSEYLDPVSEFSPNLIVNPNWGDIDGDNSPGDGWALDTGLETQSVSLAKYKLYSFSVKNSGTVNSQTVIKCTNSIKQLLSNNAFSNNLNTITIPAGFEANVLFDSLSNAACKVMGAESNKVLNLRETVVDYQVAASLDKTTCNSAPTFDNGCIMFNERTINGNSGLAVLSSNAYTNSYQLGLINTNCTASSTSLNNGHDCDTNTLLKVKPNRVCNKWLACSEKSIDPTTGEQTCYSLGECTKINESGNCTNFVQVSEDIHTFDTGNDRNTLGYSKTNNFYLANMYEVGENIKDARWDFEGTASSTGFIIPTGAAELIKDNTGLTNVTYPARGKNLLKVNQNWDQANMNLNAVSPEITVDINKSYFINYLINIDDSGSNGGKLIITQSDTAGGAQTVMSNATFAMSDAIFVTDTGHGWQRIIKKFIPAKKYIHIYLATVGGFNYPVYFDDINIESVLKVGGDTSDPASESTENNGSYVAKSCRLYPSQDSLSCKSGKKGVVADGWYGYCLEKDPKNSDNCLMWYPVDTINSSDITGISNLSSNSTSLVFDDAYYCAEVSGNFDVLEYRDTYRSRKEHGGSSCGGGDVQCNKTCSSGGSGCTPDCCDPCESGYSSNNEYCNINVDGDCSSSEPGWWVPSFCTCNPSGSAVVDLGETFTYYGYYCKLEQPYNSGDCFGNFSGNDGNCNGFEESLSASDTIYHAHQWNNGDRSGWYKYNGLEANDGPTLGVMAYDLTPSECTSAPLNGVVKPNGCFIDNINRFVPKCTKYVKTTIPWVGRIFNTLYNASSSFLGAPYNIYGRLPNGYPGVFGASIYGVNNLIGLINSNATAGLPYSCNDYGKDVNGVSTCRYITKSPTTNPTSFSVSLTGNKLYSTYSSAIHGLNTYKDVLKNIYLKAVDAVGTSTPGYNYTGNNSGGNNLSNCGPTRTNPNTFCSVLPQINNIKLKNEEGIEIVPASPGVYNIAYPGFYTLSFNTTVDSEQLPIGNLRIDWGDGSDFLDLNNIDPFTNTNNPPQFSRQFFNSGTYRLKIKVQDNWGFYSCYGLTSACSGCCKAGFEIDGMSCSNVNCLIP